MEARFPFVGIASFGFPFLGFIRLYLFWFYPCSSVVIFRLTISTAEYHRQELTRGA
jgi:hypothetical protein